MHIGPEAHPAVGTRSFQGLKWLERGAGHLSLSRVGVQVGCSYTSVSPHCLQSGWNEWDLIPGRWMQFMLCRILSLCPLYIQAPRNLIPLPAATGASRDSCCSQGRDERDTIYASCLGTAVFVHECQNQYGLSGLADRQLLSLYLTASYTSISATVL